jgi:uncharacterized membrane protein YphA (DoxX/SURF4 family)/plastocyanin
MVGSVFLSEGIQKFLYPAALGVGRFAKIGFAYPEVLAPMVGTFEIVCGVLVLVGLVTRLAVVPLAVIILTALVTTKLPILVGAGSGPVGFWAMLHEARTDWSMLLGSVFLGIVGAGPWSLDARLARRSARLQTLALMAFLGGAVGACQRPATYTPRTQEITITTVPLLVREAKGLYPFLAADFAAGGILEGKEVYAFSPSTVTVVQGDTVHFTLINPEDDDHGFLLPGCTQDDIGSFVPPDCGVDLPPQRVTHATYVARRVGTYEILCKVAKHLPMMSGQLVVLPAAIMTGGGKPGGGNGRR